MFTVQFGRVVGLMPMFATVATCTAEPLLWVLEETTAVRLPNVGLVPKVTTRWVGEEVVTEPVAPRLNVTELLALLASKPKPLIDTVVSVVWMLAVLEVTTGMTVATCTAEPLLTEFVVTTAVKVPALVGVVPKVTVSAVLLALVTVPTAPSLKVTALFAAVGSKPKPLMVTVVALAARLVVLEVTTGVMVATCTGVPLLTPLLVMEAFKIPAMTGEGRLTDRPVAEAAVGVRVPEVAPLKVTPSLIGVGSKPKPLMEMDDAVAARLAVLGVITGTIVATCTGAPLEMPLLTTAVREPIAGVLSVTVNCVGVAAVTTPVAPLERVTTLLLGVVESKPVPVMMSVVELIKTAPVLAEIVGATPMTRSLPVPPT